MEKKQLSIDNILIYILCKNNNQRDFVEIKHSFYFYEPLD